MLSVGEVTAVLRMRDDMSRVMQQAVATGKSGFAALSTAAAGFQSATGGVLGTLTRLAGNPVSWSGIASGIDGAKNSAAGMDKSFASLANTTQQLQRVSSSTIETLGKLTGAAIAMNTLKAGFTGATDAVFGMNNTLEKSERSFAVLMGDSDRARKHVADLFEIAKTTPFETQPIIDMSRMLQTMGGDALNTKENILLFGDAAAATNAPLERLSMHMPRLYSAIKNGQPFGEAARELQQMAVLSGEARLKMEAMQKSGKSGNEIWAYYESELKKFSGSMEGMSKTWDGVTSTFSDTVNILSATAFKPFFELVRDGLGELNKILGDEKFSAWATKIASAMSGGIQSALSTVVGLFKSLSSIGTEMVAVYAPIIELFRETGAQIALIVSGLLPATSGMSGFGGAMREAAAVAKPYYEAIVDVARALKEVVEIRVVGFLQEFGSTVRDILPNLRGIATTGIEAGGALLKIGASILPAVADLALSWYTSIASVVMDVVRALAPAVEWVVKFAAALVVPAFGFAVETLKLVFEVIKLGRDVIVFAAGALIDFVGWLIRLATGSDAAGKSISLATEEFNTFFGALTSIVSAARDAVEWVRALVDVADGNIEPPPPPPPPATYQAAVAGAQGLALAMGSLGKDSADAYAKIHGTSVVAGDGIDGAAGKTKKLADATGELGDKVKKTKDEYKALLDAMRGVEQIKDAEVLTKVLSGGQQGPGAMDEKLIKGLLPEELAKYSNQLNEALIKLSATGQSANPRMLDVALRLDEIATESKDAATGVSMLLNNMQYAAPSASGLAENLNKMSSAMLGLGASRGAVLPGFAPTVKTDAQIQAGQKTGTSILGGLKATLGANASNVMMQAFTGGGNVAKSIGGLAGQSIGESLGAKAAAAAAGKLAGKLSGQLMGMAGTMFGPLGTMLGGKLGEMIGGKLGKLMGGVSPEVKQARTEIAGFTDALHGTLTAEQKAEAGGEKWKMTVIAVRDAYMKTGRTAAEAEAITKQLWNDKDPLKVKAAMEQINAVLGEQQAKMAALVGEHAAMSDELAYLQGEAALNWRDMESAAKKYGIELSALGPQFQGAKLGETAQSIWNDFRMLTKNGADTGAVLHGMREEISALVNDSIAFGTSIPANMRPMIEDLMKNGDLLDANGVKMTDLSKIQFGDPIVAKLDAVADRIAELIKGIADLAERMASGLTGAAGAAASGIENMASRSQAALDGMSGAIDSTIAMQSPTGLEGMAHYAMLAREEIEKLASVGGAIGESFGSIDEAAILLENKQKAAAKAGIVSRESSLGDLRMRDDADAIKVEVPKFEFTGTIEVPMVLDGREVARVVVPYVPEVLRERGI